MKDLMFENHASCADSHNPEMWFPPDEDGYGIRDAGASDFARTICDSCEARQECLEYALQYYDLFGIWGGKDFKQRREISRALNLPARLSILDEVRKFSRVTREGNYAE